MQDKKASPGDHDAELKARLDKLSSAIRTESGHAADERKAAETPSKRGMDGNAMGTGLRVASELVAGVLVGGFIGWWLDRWLGTSPFAFIIMLLLGMAAGFWNVYRLAVRPTGLGSGGTKNG
jgi:ATP synthase protein I